MPKDFNSWNNFKQDTDKKESRPPFSQREIWWTHIGLNIGDEENGKSSVFSRPVLVVKKFNNHIFWGIPLTTQVKEKPYYHKISFQEKEQCLMISQLRLFDAKRFTSRLGKLSPNQFKKLKELLSDIILR